MKIARFNGGRIGIVVGDTIRDVTAAAGVDPAEWPPVGMVRLIANFASLRDKLAAAAQAAPPIPLNQARLETPVPWPNKVIAYPTNYRDHAAEMASTTRADLQGYFLKANSSLSGPNDAIELPDIPGREVHHECEIALVIGTGGRQIPAARAMAHVFGYACLLDITITPAGVGPIRDGDRVTIEVDHVGRMSVPVVAGKRGSSLVFSAPYEFKRAPA